MSSKRIRKKRQRITVEEIPPFRERETNTALASMYYWLAINRASVAMSPLPLPRDRFDVYPMPELLVGFSTAKEARDTQDFLLTADITKVHERVEELLKRAERDEVVAIHSEHPESPTKRPTEWRTK